EVGQFLKSRLGTTASSDLARRVHRATSGNPFLVAQIEQTLLADKSLGRTKSSWLETFRVPDRVAEIVRKHLDHLPEPTVTALSTASVIGREFDLPLLRDLCGIDPARGIGDLEPALLEGVVKESAGSAGIYFFSHALIRETLYHQLAPSRRLALHF